MHWKNFIYRIVFKFLSLFIDCSINEQYDCVQFWKMSLKTQDIFQVLRKVYKSPWSTQRKLTSDLGFSLGKLNFFLKALKDKSLIKIENFKNSKTNYHLYNMSLLQKGLQKEQN